VSDDKTSQIDYPWLLELEDVSVVRDHNHILHRLSLAIPNHQHTVILGPNGSGKTSLLKILIRQFYPSVDDDQTGVVRIFGQSVWNVAELRQHLGIVSGELDHEFASPRSGRMTALQAVLSGLDGVRLVSRIASQDRHSVDAAREALARMNATSIESRTLATMSTGERRRVLIARALIHRPAALILDEPTTGLDISARSRFLDQLDALAAQGTTIILVTHHIEEIIAEISHVILLKHGQLFGAGKRSELIQNDSMSQLFDYPIEIQKNPVSGRFIAVG
jgi:iron complex transport system ATP-binding protein